MTDIRVIEAAHRLLGEGIFVAAYRGDLNVPWAGTPAILIDPADYKLAPRLIDWLVKAKEAAGRGAEVILLQRTPKTGGTWWRTHVYPSATALAFPGGVSAIYWGQRPEEFRETFEPLGPVIPLKEPDAQWRIKVSEYLARREIADGNTTAEERLSRALRSIRADREAVETLQTLLLAEAMRDTQLSLRELSRLSGVPLATLSRNHSKARAS